MDFILRMAASTAAGLLSFLSPCVFPLVPSYLAMLAGSSVSELRSDSMSAGSIRTRSFTRSAAFSLGFSAVFIILGLVFSQAGAMIGGGGRVWAVVAGAVIVLLGLNTAFDFISVLNVEKRFHIAKRPTGYLSAFLFGAAFGAGWSPCVGPILASILFLAGSGSPVQAGLLLATYSLGLALPFMLAGLFFDRLQGLLETLKRHMGLVKKLSGMLLVLIGLYMILGDLRTLSGDLTRIGYVLRDLADSQKNALRIAAAGAHLLAAALFFFGFLLKRRRHRKGIGFAVLTTLFALFSVLEASGLISTAKLLASWLLFTGI